MQTLDLQDHLVIATPEGVEVDVVVAGLGSRAVACILDSLILVAGFFAVWLASRLVAGALPGVAAAMVYLGLFMVVFGYYPLLEAFGGGRTIGKRATGLRVVAADGSRASFWRIVIRNVVRLVDYLPSMYLTGIISILVTRRHQRLGDLAAGTIVVRERLGAEGGAGRRGAPVASPAQWAAAAAAPPQPVPPEAMGWDLSRVTPAEVQAVRTFLDRRHSLPPQVRYSLAYDFAMRLHPRVVGPPTEYGPERFLEWVVYVKQARG